jgi:hypothetical protein
MWRRARGRRDRGCILMEAVSGRRPTHGPSGAQVSFGVHTPPRVIVGGEGAVADLVAERQRAGRDRSGCRIVARRPGFPRAAAGRPEANPFQTHAASCRGATHGRMADGAPKPHSFGLVATSSETTSRYRRNEPLDPTSSRDEVGVKPDDREVVEATNGRRGAGRSDAERLPTRSKPSQGGSASGDPGPAPTGRQVWTSDPWENLANPYLVPAATCREP